jgi:hypothetical protein
MVHHPLLVNPASLSTDQEVVAADRRLARGLLGR